MNAAAVSACGMTTAVGLTAAATCAAVRARLDNFQETRFISRDGDWIYGAEVPLSEGWRGPERLVRLLVGPLRECYAACRTPPEEVPVLLCLSERARAGRMADIESRVGSRLIQELGHGLPQASQIYSYGLVGGAVALRDARALIARGVSEVIVAGVDCYLNAAALRSFDTDDRLLTDTNSNGFIPGEAGAAVLLRPGNEGPVLAGLGFGTEEAPIGSGKPLRGDGMVTAMRQALDEAGIAYADISYRIADVSGEQYYFKEASLAQARLWRGKGDPEEIWHPCDCTGQTGAASIPICLGVSYMAGLKGYAPGPVALLHAADHDGRRAAVVLRTGG